MQSTSINGDSYFIDSNSAASIVNDIDSISDCNDTWLSLEAIMRSDHHQQFIQLHNLLRYIWTKDDAHATMIQIITILCDRVGP